ncbi:MAG: hypothetical protein WCB12_05560 [Bryobacteraceae bacterium]
MSCTQTQAALGLATYCAIESETTSQEECLCGGMFDCVKASD